MTKRHSRMPKSWTSGWRLSFCLLALASGLSGCHKQNAGAAVVIKSQLASPSPHVGLATIAIQLSDAKGKPVSGAQVSLEGDMSHAGMGPTFGQAKEISPGHYQGTLQFGMAGDWVVLTHVILADGRKFEQQMDVNGVQAN
jgi:hypothetical protein